MQNLPGAIHIMTLYLGWCESHYAFIPWMMWVALYLYTLADLSHIIPLHLGWLESHYTFMPWLTLHLYTLADLCHIIPLYLGWLESHYTLIPWLTWVTSSLMAINILQIRPAKVQQLFSLPDIHCAVGQIQRWIYLPEELI